MMTILLTSRTRSNPPEVFLGKGVLQICSKFTGEHPCRNEISIKVHEIALRHGCSPVNLLHIFRTPFPRNTSGWLLLKDDIQLKKIHGVKFKSGSYENESSCRDFIKAIFEFFFQKGIYKKLLRVNFIAIFYVMGLQKPASLNKKLYTFFLLIQKS